ncbi:translation initiation factor IF-2 [Candidatus Peregrinibacteria bacterium]|nr:translation initiation factor IF-2 [Candidatus Peregrinibacteria bacterium]
MMRLADIAKELRITSQELRRELAKTNFGITPGTHEVEDALARGIVRFLKTRVRPTLSHEKRTAAVVNKEGKVIIKEKSVGAVGIGVGTGHALSASTETSKKKETRQVIFLKDEFPEEETAAPRIDEDRKAVPKESPTEKAVSLGVSRRIELDSSSAANTTGAPLPHTYYKAGKKKRHKGAEKEEKILEILGRHPNTAARRKQQVARVRHVAEEGSNLTLQEIEIEKELDRERFREQKKHRAIGQKRGAKAQPQIKAKIGIVELPEITPIKEFAEKTGLLIPDVISRLAKNGILATINQKIDFDTAAIIAEEMGVQVKKAQHEVTSADLFEGDLKKLLQEDDSKNLKPRPPVISVMGHVDHGKTKILDAIRNANVVASEAGGITQHIGAYQVEVPSPASKSREGEADKGIVRKITFLDTPGHEAFTAMRARGAKATDIAILVVAADEGVKPQTIEAIHHAKEAGIPIIVAINKIDKPAADIDHVKGELNGYGLQAEDWGGKTVMVPVSALTGEGIDRLLEMILLVAEMENLKANPKRPAVGTVIESNLDPAMGPVATIVINTGTLNIGDNVVAGTIPGKIKAMVDHTGKKVETADPSAAVKISGLSRVPQAGDLVQVFANEQIAKRRAEELKNLQQEREKALSGSMVERIVSQIHTGKINFLKIVLKADAKGSLEAITHELQKIQTSEVAIKVIHYGVGNITETDVIMASASQGLVIGFNTEVSSHMRRLAEKEHVDIRVYNIIYKLADDLKAILSGMLEPEEAVVELGKVRIKKIFLTEKNWTIIGGEVTQGIAEQGAKARLVRNGQTLFETKIDALRRVREEVKSLDKGAECGIKINTPKLVAEGDILEIYKVERKERSL